jgi:hypothetical protein
MTLKWPKAVALFAVMALEVLNFKGLAARVLRNDSIVFLREQDPVPAGAILLREFRLSAQSYADSCAWFELLLKGSRIATSTGGNLVKIVDREEHERNGCDALDLAVYRVDSPCNADRAFRWTPSRKLRWEDFHGPERIGAVRQIAAESVCGISVETSLAPVTARARIYVFNTFDKEQSWTRPDKQSGAVLRHEQGHWDLCEIYTRRMQARFDAQTISGNRLDEMVTKIYDQVSRDYEQRQRTYEMETGHGTDPAGQQRWELLIARELSKN